VPESVITNGSAPESNASTGNGANGMIKHLVLEMVQAVVNSPGSVRVDEMTNHDSTLYEVYVDPSDIGYAIGKEGRVANAIRTVVKEAAKRNGMKAYVDVKGFAPVPETMTDSTVA
jgi:predicted RNA-binding protein YlqC (UPF0109 family)